MLDHEAANDCEEDLEDENFDGEEPVAVEWVPARAQDLPEHLGELRTLVASGRYLVERCETDFGEALRLVAKGRPDRAIARITIELLA